MNENAIRAAMQGVPALQAINVVAAMLVFPAVYLFARALKLRFETSVIAATLFAFFPNVWFFGGTAFSDIPSIVLVLFAVTFLMRGAEDRNAYWLGTLLLALAMGIRPQNLLVGLFPGIYATRKRRASEIAVAVIIGLTVVGVAFGASIYATGTLDQYLQVVREHSDYIARVDSWRSAVRPPLWRLLDRFFVKQYSSPLLSVIASLFALTGIIGSIRARSRAMLWNALTFVPFAITAWLMLLRCSVTRFSIGYQPMFAIFIADGILRVARQRMRVAATIAGVLLAAFIVYTVPALNTVRNEIAPSVLATSEVARRVDPRTAQLYVGHTMSKFVDLLLPGMPYTHVVDDRALPLAARGNAWLLAEITETPETGFVFRRKRGHLWNIARRHYFEVKLEPLARRPHFVSGWYAPESMDIQEWRWMSKHSVTLLPPGRGTTILGLHLGVPGELMARNPEITVTLNGVALPATSLGSTSSVLGNWSMAGCGP